MHASRTIRAFFGLELGAEARSGAAALARELRSGPGGDGVRWVAEESLHVTLRFLGSIEAARVPDLARHVGEETGDVAPFALALGRLHAFPSPRRPRVVALELEPTAPVEALARAVERGVVAAAFPPEERPFRAHVTLGRVQRGRRLRLPDVTGPVTVPAEAWEVMETVLFQSETEPSGARYTPLERIPLGAPAPPASSGGSSSRNANEFA